MSKAFVADRYINRITYRVPSDYERDRQMHVTVHETWEAAHAWLVQDRENKVKRTKQSLAKAEAALKRAAAMKRPHSGPKP